MKGKAKILQFGDPILGKASEKVKDPKSNEIKLLVEDMMSALKEHGEHGAGLSAPQIGNLSRVVICRRLDLEEKVKQENGKTVDEKDIWEVMVNPEIISKSESQSTYWEGCLSVNNGDLFGEVTRSKKVEVKYLDLKGVEKSLKAHGYFSHVVQHELDHINGILFLSYIKDPSLLYTSDELDKMREQD